MRCRMAGAGVLLFVAGVAVGCGVRRIPVVAGALPGGLDAFLAGHPLASGQPLRADEIARTSTASWHLVQVRDAERPHRHREHDLAVFVLRGEGVLTLDGAAVPLRAGDAALVPRDHPHWFARTGAIVAVALIGFTPPLDGPDVTPEPDVDTRGGRR